MNTSRRNWMVNSLTAAASLAAASTGVVAAPAPLHIGKPRLRLSLAAYSFRDYFKDIDHARKVEPDPAKKIDLFQFIDYCFDHHCDGAELTAYYFPNPITDEFLLKLKRYAFLKGIAISGSAVGNSFTQTDPKRRQDEINKVKKWIDHAAILGAPHIRVFAGSADLSPKEEAKKLCVEALREVLPYAASKGVFLGIENHGGIVAEADDLLDIVTKVDHPWLGINLDTGNFHTEDLYGDIARCVPYAVNVQIKVEVRPKGAKENQSADLERVVKILKDANYQGFAALEYEAKPDPYEAIPGFMDRLHKLFA